MSSVLSGEPVDLDNCAREPIHLSGAIQPHGALLAVCESDLMVSWASANTEAHLGLAVEDVLGAPLASVVGDEAARLLRSRLEDPRSLGADPLQFHPPDRMAFDVSWHRSDGLVVIELEPMGVGEGLSMSHLFADVRRAMLALEISDDVQALCDHAAAEIRKLTGYDRVMIYRFHPDDHGEVVAEEKEAGLESFLGLHYPASDIPTQARKLFMLNHLRVIADAAYEPVPLLAAPHVVHGHGMPPTPPDLTMSGLRSVSPMHVAYLRNMGVGATLTLSLLHGTRLWGMVACHHRSPRRIDPQVRAACRVLGQLFAVQVVTREREQRHEHRSRLAEQEMRLLASMATAPSLAEALRGQASSPVELAGADGMVARIDGQTIALGVTPTQEAVQTLLTQLSVPQQAGSLVCDDLPHRFPAMEGFAAHASGVLALPLTAGYQDFVMWFRGERVVAQRWAGDPSAAKSSRTVTPTDGSPAYETLTPRASFEAWTTQVRGHCVPWAQAEVDTALSLAAAVPELLLARARDRLAHQALHDELTGLPNRTLLMDRCGLALARRDRTGSEVAMLFVDLDRFKQVNDTLGHSAGDELLRQSAARLLAVTRATDTVARMGGDEFVILCESSSLAVAKRLSTRVVQAFQSPFSLDDRLAAVTASVGVAVADQVTSPGDLLRDADLAMYQVKHSGRNAAKSFTREMREITLRRVEIETQLRPALEQGDLRLFFQPLHDLSGALKGFEALARWPLAGRGMVPPTEFIPVAESTGLIAPLTAWALDVGLQALARWRTARPDLDLTLAVNIAASQLGSDELRHHIDRALRRNQLPAHALCLEITESALVANDPRNRSFLHRLRKQGVKLSIDDFGTGYSSLSYLTMLPVHELKVDRSFISGLPSRSGDMAVVASVVGLAHQLGLTAVAEGVETPEQLSAISLLGCDTVQGYLFGRPMPEEVADRYVADLEAAPPHEPAPPGSRGARPTGPA